MNTENILKMNNTSEQGTADSLYGGRYTDVIGKIILNNNGKGLVLDSSLSSFSDGNKTSSK